MENVAKQECRGNAKKEDKKVGCIGEEPSQWRAPFQKQLFEEGQLELVKRWVALAAEGFPDGVEVAYQHRLLVGEGVEAVLAVVAAHSTCAHPTKGQCVDRQMDECVISTHAAT